jgi:hypothetical protein
MQVVWPNLFISPQFLSFEFARAWLLNIHFVPLMLLFSISLDYLLSRIQTFILRFAGRPDSSSSISFSAVLVDVMYIFVPDFCSYRLWIISRAHEHLPSHLHEPRRSRCSFLLLSYIHRTKYSDLFLLYYPLSILASIFQNQDNGFTQICSNAVSGPISLLRVLYDDKDIGVGNVFVDFVNVRCILAAVEAYVDASMMYCSGY